MKHGTFPKLSEQKPRPRNKKPRATKLLSLALIKESLGNKVFVLNIGTLSMNEEQGRKSEISRNQGDLLPSPTGRPSKSLLLPLYVTGTPFIDSLNLTAIYDPY